MVESNVFEFKSFFDDLSSKKPKYSLENLIDRIDILDEVSIEIFYVLILEYYIRNEKSKKMDLKEIIINTIPYKGKKASKNGGVVFRIDKIPIPLQNILANYLDHNTN